MRIHALQRGFPVPSHNGNVLPMLRALRNFGSPSLK
jgi:hypothetical protein